MADEAQDSVISEQETEDTNKNTDSQKQLAKLWMEEIEDSEKCLKDRFKQMKNDMDFAYKWGIGKQWPDQTEADERYIANFTQRHISARTSTLYAKNPTAVYKKRERLDFAIWDGSEKSVMEALQALESSMASMMQPPQEAIALLEDIQQAEQERKQTDKLGKTLELLFSYYITEGDVTFKASMKQMVRRALTCGVGYVRPGYQRLEGKKPDDQARLADSMNQIKHIEGLQKTIQSEGESKDNEAMLEELKTSVESLQSADVIYREGATFDFPKSTSVIFDKRCTQIVGWVHARWIAEIWYLSPQDIIDIWGVDIGTDYSKYGYGKGSSSPTRSDDDSEESKDALTKVYMRQDKVTGTVAVLCDGYSGFISPPKAPDIKIERFFTIFPLAFNQIEHHDSVIPPSDVTLIRHQQMEYNRSKEALRIHRKGNLPRHVASATAFEQSDKTHLTEEPEAHSILLLKGLDEKEKISDVLQPFPTIPIDPALYETNTTLKDVGVIVGEQESNVGGNAGSATQASIDESSRISSVESNTDDLNELLSEVVKATGQILMRNLPKENVMEIAGRGAVWPDMSYEQIIRGVWLEIEAGSSGRPNRGKDIAEMERLSPLLVQIPGAAEAVSKRVMMLADETGEMHRMLEDGIANSIPSLQAMNAQASAAAQVPTGDPATDPAQQGAQGARNLPANGIPTDAAQGVQGAQPEYTQ